MNVDETMLMSVDDHVVEPPDLFDKHMPDKWRVPQRGQRERCAPLAHEPIRGKK